MLIQLLFACGANITNMPNTDLYEKPEEIDSEVTEEVEDTNSSEDSNSNNGSETNEEVPNEDNGSTNTDPEESEGSQSETTDANPSNLTDYSLPGSYSYTSMNSTATVTNCMEGLSYTVYTPDTTNDTPVVILGHGFLRGGEKMFGWAEHFASWGIKTVVPTLCHYNVFNGVDHEMNGQNMVELAAVVGATSPIYAGQSAGGLAAVVAAAIDPTALGVVGLDATDTAGVPGVADNIGLNYVMNVTTPAFALVGEPSTCNSNNNGATMYQGISTSQIIRVTDSDHCDYESPTDWGCESFCLNEATTLSDDAIRPVIQQLATSALLWIAGTEIDAQDHWSSANLSSLENAGSIVVIK